MTKTTHFTDLLLLNIDIDIAIFCKFRIDILSKLKKNDIEAALLWRGSGAESGCHKNSRDGNRTH